MLDELLTRGYCHIENVIPVEELVGVGESVERDVRAHTVLPLPTGYVPGFLRFNQALVPYVASHKIMGLVNSVFGPHARISMFTGTVNGPGIQRGELHSDWPYNHKNAAHIPAPYPDCLLHLVTMWMLSDFTEDGGGTIVVPGSHRGPGEGECQLTGKAGTVVAFDARLKHAVAPNITSRPRVAVIVRYAPWWLNLDPLRPGTIDRADIVEAHQGPDSQVPGLPVEVFRRLPPEVQALVHYSVETGG